MHRISTKGIYKTKKQRNGCKIYLENELNAICKIPGIAITCYELLRDICYKIKKCPVEVTF